MPASIEYALFLAESKGNFEHLGTFPESVIVQHDLQSYAQCRQGTFNLFSLT